MGKIQNIIENNYKDYYKKDDWICIKSGYIYIPFRIPNFDCLVQDIRNLNIFYATVMRLCKLNIVEIPKIQEILGVDKNVLDEVIVDLIQSKLAYTRENKLMLTTFGELALKEDKEIVQYKYTINRMAVNLITDEIICWDDTIFYRPKKNDLILNDELDINVDYLKKHFEKLNSIYEHMQKEDSHFGNKAITKEIYKIISVNYTTLKYQRVKYSIFLNEQTEQIEVKIFDNQEALYSKAFHEQIKKCFPSLESFFEKNYKFSQKVINYELPEFNSEFEYDYQTTRFKLYPSEYMDYILHCKEFDFEFLLINCEDCYYYFSEVFVEIGKISNSKKVIINYDQHDKGFKSFANKLIKYGNKVNLKFIPHKDINATSFMLYPFVGINLMKRGVPYSNNVISYIESKMFFDLKLPHEKIEDILEGNNQ